MFYLCDKERIDSVKRLINLIINSEYIDEDGKVVKDGKDILKKDLKKISSIRCQNSIESLYVAAIEKKKKDEEEENNKRVEKINKELKEVWENNQRMRTQGTSKHSNSRGKALTEMERKNLKYLQELNEVIEDNYSKYKHIKYEYNAAAENQLTLYQIFERLNLLNADNIGHIFKIESEDMYKTLYAQPDIELRHLYIYIYINKDLNKLHLISNTSSEEYDEGKKKYNFNPQIYKSDDRFNIENIKTDDFKEKIEEIGEVIETDHDDIEVGGRYVEGNIGGYAKSSKFKTKEVLGKLRRVYKIPNSKKEHIKHRGNLITVSEYKALMKLKNKK